MRRGEGGARADEVDDEEGVEAACRGVMAGVLSVAGQARSSTPTGSGSVKLTLVQPSICLAICKSRCFSANRVDSTVRMVLVLDPSFFHTLGKVNTPSHLST